MARYKSLKSDPQTQIQVANMVDKAKKMKESNPSLTDVRKIINSKEIAGILESIIENSTMDKSHKVFLRTIFIEKLPRKTAIRRAFGSDLGYAEEPITEGLMQHPAIKDFIDIIKSMYVQIAPVAALKEVEMILSDKVDSETKLKAIQDVQNRAGIRSDDPEANQSLPVKITINMPAPQQGVSNNQVNVHTGLDDK